MIARELFRTEKIPVFQNKMFDSEAAAIGCPAGDVVLAQDMRTGLVSNIAFDPTLLEYDDQYQNEQAFSLVFQKHLQEVTEIIHRRCGGKSILEIGCGKGYFVQQLQSLGHAAVGIDPAYEGNSSYIVRDRYRPGLGLTADFVVLRHVLEHMADPLIFLTDIARTNRHQGMIYIEVPCFDWICRNRAWFDVFYEHVNYFNLDNFHGIFGEIHESGHLFGGQYLYVLADLASLRSPQFAEPIDFPIDFLSSLESLLARLAAGKRRAIWGAAAKGMMLALYMRRAGLGIDVVIDINPAKQDKYLAGTGLRVLSPEKGLALLSPGDEILITNSNYTEEISSMSHDRFNYVEVDRHGI